jgi:hypothetical protein
MSPLLHDAMFYSSDKDYVAGIRGSQPTAAVPRC